MHKHQYTTHSDDASCDAVLHLLVPSHYFDAIAITVMAPLAFKSGITAGVVRTVFFSNEIDNTPLRGT